MISLLSSGPRGCPTSWTMLLGAYTGFNTIGTCIFSGSPSQGDLPNPPISQPEGFALDFTLHSSLQPASPTASSLSPLGSSPTSTSSPSHSPILVQTPLSHLGCFPGLTVRSSTPSNIEGRESFPNSQLAVALLRSKPSHGSLCSKDKSHLPRVAELLAAHVPPVPDLNSTLHSTAFAELLLRATSLSPETLLITPALLSSPRGQGTLWNEQPDYNS